MKRFPAESDDKGNKLMSAGFDFVNIVDQNGKTFNLSKQTSSQNIKTNALPTNYRIKRLVSKDLIKCDENKNKEGVQIGFYWFTNNSWVKIGEATIYGGSNESDAKQIKDTNDTNYQYLWAVLTDNDIYQNTLPMDRYYNLDYVVTSCGTPQELTLKLNVKDDKGNPIATFGYYYDGGFYTDVISNTDIKITIPAGGSFNKNNLQVYDPFNYSPISQSQKECSQPDNKTVRCNIKIENPYSLTLSGELVDEQGKPIANRYIYTSQGQHTTTGTDGKFSLKAKSGYVCVYAYPQQLTCVNVDKFI